jgi:23S rRNA pseudouridine1911/1915/1917 synthase
MSKRGDDFRNFHATEQQGGLALVAALRQFLAGESWSAVRRLIENCHVQINGNLCRDEGRRLQQGDVVKVWKEPRGVPATAEDIKILFQDAHLIVVDKPAGVTTQRHAEEQQWSSRRRQRQSTIDEMILQILHRRRGRQARSAKPARPPRVRLVHRLDRDTSGVMVLALGADAERRLVQMFRKHQIHRAYHALAQGRVETQTMSSNLVRDRGDGRRGSTKLPNCGKRAVTHVRPLQFLDGYTLIECRLETGRTHQIRIHLAEAGHPLCGEKVYNKLLFGKPVVDRSGAQRQALHAAELGFRHPITGQEMMFKTPLPPDMEKLLAALGGRA